ISRHAMVLFFFFQAEDGIRDGHVTGVQTCALPILQFSGPCGRLAGDLLHYTIRDFGEHEANVERYSALAAQQMFEAGKRHWRGAWWLATPWSFFQNFILRGGFLDGHRGALISRMAARTVRLKYEKLGKLTAA